MAPASKGALLNIHYYYYFSDFIRRQCEPTVFINDVSEVKYFCHIITWQVQFDFWK